MKIKLLLYGVFHMAVNQLVAQSQDSLKTSHLALGIGVPYHAFRDRVASDLAYQGFGFAELNLSKIKVNPNHSLKQFDINLGLGSAQPNIINKTAFNKSATMIYYNFAYAYLKQLPNPKKETWHFFAGGKAASDAQYIIYPTINNVRAYSFNWLSLQASAMAIYELKLGKRNHRFGFHLSIPLLSINARPLSYNGVIPEESVWDQEGSAIRAYFTNLKLSSIHNNLMLQSQLFWDFNIKKNNLRLTYTWLYQNNTVSVNSLNSVRSSLSVSYLINRKKS